jgi:hypothetical protein
LKNIDWELVVHFAIDDLLARLEHGLNLLYLQRVFPRASELAKIVVRRSARQFHAGHGSDERGWKGPSGDGEILDGALGLGAVVGICRYEDFAHGVDFGAELGHCLYFLSQKIRKY